MHKMLSYRLSEVNITWLKRGTTLVVTLISRIVERKNHFKPLWSYLNLTKYVVKIKCQVNSVSISLTL